MSVTGSVSIPIPIIPIPMIAVSIPIISITMIAVSVPTVAIAMIAVVALVIGHHGPKIF